MILDFTVMCPFGCNRVDCIVNKIDDKNIIITCKNCGEWKGKS